MRVAFISSDNKSTSGAFLSMVELCKKLKEKYNIKSYVILPFSGSGQRLLKKEKIPYEVIFSFTWLVVKSQRNNFFQKGKKIVAKTYNRISILKIQKFIKKNSIDIVHINTSCSYVGAIAAKKAKVKFVWHIREFLEEHSDLTLWNRPQNNELIAKADKVIVISNSLAEKYKSIIPKEKLSVVYDGIDIEQFLPREPIFNEAKYKFVFVGALYVDKGIEELLKACSLLTKFCPKISYELQVVGQGESTYEEKLKKMVKELKIDSYVKFLGVRNDVNVILNKADIAFTCSKAEAFGRVTVEAMMAGCLAIGGNTAATAEIIMNNQTGILYQQGNAENLYETLADVLNKKREMQIIANQGKKYANNNFSLDKSVLKVKNIYDDILKRGI